MTGVATEFVRLDPPVTGKGSFRWKTSATDFGQTEIDPVMYLGYNLAETGVGIDKEITGLGHGFYAYEGDYQRPDQSRWMEAYVEMHPPGNGAQWRPIQYYAKTHDTSNTAQEAIEGFASDLLFEMPKAGARIYHVDNDPAVQANLRWLWQPARFEGFGAAGVDTDVRLHASSGQASRFLLGHSGTDDVVEFRTDGTSQASFKLCGRFFSFFATNNNTGASFCVGGQSNDGVLTVMGGGHWGNNPSIISRKRASQTGSLFEAQSNDGATVYSRFDQNGYFMTRKTVAPADADLASGEMALWFDSTNGAAKLMVKAKEAGGTVRTATVALT